MSLSVYQVFFRKIQSKKGVPSRTNVRAELPFAFIVLYPWSPSGFCKFRLMAVWLLPIAPCSGQLDLQVCQQIHRLWQRELGILHAAAQNIHLIARGVPEIRFAQIALVKFRFVQFCVLEIR